MRNCPESSSLREREKRRNRRRVKSCVNLMKSLSDTQSHGSQQTLDETLKKLDAQDRHKIELRVHGLMKDLSAVPEDEKGGLKKTAGEIMDRLSGLLRVLHLAEPKPFVAAG